MTAETAKIVVVAAAGVAFVAWLFGVKAFLRIVGSPDRLESSETLEGRSLQEARKGLLQAALAQQQVSVIEKTEDTVIVEAQYPGKAILGFALKEVYGGVQVDSVVDVSRVNRIWRLVAGIHVLGLEALAVLGLPVVMFLLVIPNENPQVRRQVFQTFQLVHVLWPPLLFGFVHRRAVTEARRMAANLVTAAEVAE